MGSGLRIPLPWEADLSPRRVQTDLEEAPVREPYEVTSARALAEQLGQAGDPDRGRRGAEGGAAWVNRELRKIGVDQPLHVTRERMNAARTRCANRRG